MLSLRNSYELKVDEEKIEDHNMFKANCKMSMDYCLWDHLE